MLQVWLLKLNRIFIKWDYQIFNKLISVSMFCMFIWIKTKKNKSFFYPIN